MTTFVLFLLVGFETQRFCIMTKVFVFYECTVTGRSTINKQVQVQVQVQVDCVMHERVAVFVLRLNIV